MSAVDKLKEAVTEDGVGLLVEEEPLPKGVGVVICYRMSSSRFPGKPLANIQDPAGRVWCLLQLVVTRAISSGLPVVVATTADEEDQPIRNGCALLGVECHSTELPADDVLGRVWEVVQARDWNAVIRVGGDCPFVCPEQIARMARLFMTAGVSYMDIRIDSTPGVFTKLGFPEALSRSFVQASYTYARSMRENVTTAGITAFQGSSKHMALDPPPPAPIPGPLCVDHPEDIPRLERIWREGGVPWLS